MLRPSRERLENAALEGSGSSAKRNKLPLAPSTPAVSKSAETCDVRRPVSSPWKQRKVCGATRQQAAIGGFTLQHPLGMAVTCQVRNPSPPRSAGPLCQGNLAPLPFSVSISDSKVLGGCFAWQCALLRLGHWLPGQLPMLPSRRSAMEDIHSGSEVKAKILFFASS